MLFRSPERAPRAPKNENGEEKENRKSRFTRRDNSDDELSTWSEGSISGTSIGDLLANAKGNK